MCDLKTQHIVLQSLGDDGGLGHRGGFDNSNLIDAFRAARIADAAAEQQRQAHHAAQHAQQQQYAGADDGRYSSAAQQQVRVSLWIRVMVELLVAVMTHPCSEQLWLVNLGLSPN